MANQEDLERLRRGVKTWNEWRRTHPAVDPDLSVADLCIADLSGADLSLAALGGVDFSGADLSGADLSGADLSDADLFSAILSGATLSGASLPRAVLDNANLYSADLSGTDLKNANLGDANLTNATLSGADLTNARLGGARLQDACIGATIFTGLDLRAVEGLETIRHRGPSDISISTIYLSEGQIPEAFLRGCGVPEDFITYMPSLTAKAIDFYSCFISYSGEDEQFARRLYSRMREANLRVWFAPEDMKGGDKIHEQIDRAIQYHDRLLLVLSESSLQSKWVETEIRRARKVELKESRRRLFPIRLVSYEALQQWVCIDSTTGEDLAEEVRSYFIPDFSNWKSHDEFERAFARLYADLKASAE